MNSIRVRFTLGGLVLGQTWYETYMVSGKRLDDAPTNRMEHFLT